VASEDGDGGLDAKAPDGEPECRSSLDCKRADRAFCDRGTCQACGKAEECKDQVGRNQCDNGTCVACLVSDHCPSDTPICAGDKTCTVCASEKECAMRSESTAAGLCENGRCTLDKDALFVDDDNLATMADCKQAQGTPASPFCNIQDAINKLPTADQELILVLTGSYPGFKVTTSVRIIAKGICRIDQGNADKPRVDIDGDGTVVTVRGFEVSGASAVSDGAISCHNKASCVLEELNVFGNGLGVGGETARLLVVDRSRVHDNAYGGISTRFTDYRIQNNFLYGNGSPTASMVGGATLGQGFTQDATARTFRNNTLFSNRASTSAQASDCSAPTVLTSNILWDNGLKSTGIMCSVDHSITDDTGLLGTDISNDDPRFVSTANRNNPDLHIREGSPAIDKALSEGAPKLDIDGKARDAKPDIGADEL
jgi:hypothetical protein